jgi:hypothetical protein
MPVKEVPLNWLCSLGGLGVTPACEYGCTDMTTSKFRIKMGEVEVEYEGNDDFLKKELPDLLAAVSKLHKEAGVVPPRPEDGAALARPLARGNMSRQSLSGTTATIAAKLGGESGAELMVAAAAQLTFVQGKDEFTTKELRAACRGAKNLWKKSFANNFTNYLATLVKDHSLLEARTGVYALHAKKKQELEPRLATD